MKWFKKTNNEAPDGEPENQQVGELLDPYHHRASISDGGQIMIEPGKVRTNIEHAMQRLDLDIETPISIEEDVVSEGELLTLVQRMAMGPALIECVVNTAVAIMDPRYPAELVRAPLPEQYDLRKLLPQVSLADHQHELAKTIFNQRLAANQDLDMTQVESMLTGCDDQDQVQVFIAVFFMYGNKLGAIKHRTGTP